MTFVFCIIMMVNGLWWLTLSGSNLFVISNGAHGSTGMCSANDHQKFESVSNYSVITVSKQIFSNEFLIFNNDIVSEVGINYQLLTSDKLRMLIFNSYTIVFDAYYCRISYCIISNCIRVCTLKSSWRLCDILKVITYARTMIHNVSKIQIGRQNLTNVITFFTRTLFLKIQ